MEIKRIDEVEEAIASLEAAFLASLAEASSEPFMAALGDAMVMIYVDGPKDSCIGLEWMHRSIKSGRPEFASQLQGLIPNPTEFFLRFSEYNPLVISVTSSTLLQLIPEKERLEFIRAVILRHGPNSKRWTWYPTEYGISPEDLTDLAFDLLESDEATPEAREEFVLLMTAGRSLEKVKELPELALFGLENYRAMAEICAELNPLSVLETVSVKHWHNGLSHGFAWQVDHIAGAATLARVVAIAIDTLGYPTEKGDEYELRLEILRHRNLVTLVEGCLKSDNAELYDELAQFCFNDPQFEIVATYQSGLHRLIKQYPGELADRISQTLQARLQDRGWYIGTVLMGMHQLKPIRYVERITKEDVALRYVQPYGSRFFPARGEEVLYCVSAARKIGAKTFVATFVKLQ